MIQAGWQTDVKMRKSGIAAGRTGSREQQAGGTGRTRRDTGTESGWGPGRKKAGHGITDQFFQE